MRRNRFRQTVALVTFAAIVGIAVGVRAQSYQFHRVVAVLREVGFIHRVDKARGWLNDRQSDTFSIGLAAGTEYALAATCDEDCTDIDLVLYGPDGIPVASDRLTDDEPVLRVTPRQSGPHRLRVTMADCEVEPCAYTVGVFTRPR